MRELMYIRQLKSDKVEKSMNSENEFYIMQKPYKNFARPVKLELKIC